MAAGHGAAELASLFLFADGGAFVVALFAAGDAEFELGAAVLEIDGQGNQRGAALFALGFEAAEFAFVDEELSLAERVVGDGGFFVGVDVAAVEDQFAAFDAGEGFGELAASQAEGFDLAAEQGQAAFDLGGDEIIVQGAAVGDARGEVLRGVVFHRMAIVLRISLTGACGDLRFVGYACGCGEIGRRARFRFLWGNPCWFNSSQPH